MFRSFNNPGVTHIMKMKSTKTKISKKKVSQNKKGPAKKVSSRGQSRKNAVKAPVKSAVVSKEKKKKPVKMKIAERRVFRAKLLALREQLDRQINSLKEESLTRNDSVVSAEDGTDAFDRQMAINLASAENSSVLEIDDALRRIDEGAYGVCEECNGMIERVRLEALPFVRMCIKCQSNIEKNGTREPPALSSSSFRLQEE